MRRVACPLGLLAVLALVLPVVARADTIDIINHFGGVTITDAGIVSKQSQLWSYNGVQAGKGHALGSVYFATGAFIASSGSIWTGGQFSSVGSSFIVKCNGNYGTYHGVVFSGSFEGPIDWTMVLYDPSTHIHEYQLTGTIQGQLWNGHMAKGTTTQTIYTYWGQEAKDHQGNIHLGTSRISPTPEPGTLGLLGTGLIVIAGVIGRKRAKNVNPFC